MKNPFEIVREFEAALCEYTGAPYAVTTTSCSMALLLAVAWHLRPPEGDAILGRREVSIPKRTYVSVPQSIIHAGGQPTFRDEKWHGQYQLRPLPVWDAARWFTAGMYACETLDHAGQMQCVSFHWSKTLGIEQGGAILHDNPEADAWLRRARFDGRTEGVDPKDDTFTQLGWHAYMSPEVAAKGLVRLRWLPNYNEPLPNDDYPDLSKMPIFQ